MIGYARAVLLVEQRDAKLFTRRRGKDSHKQAGTTVATGNFTLSLDFVTCV